MCDKARPYVAPWAPKRTQPVQDKAKYLRLRVNTQGWTRTERALPPPLALLDLPGQTPGIVKQWLALVLVPVVSACSSGGAGSGMDAGVSDAVTSDTVISDARDEGMPPAPGSTEALLDEACAGRPRTGPAMTYAYSTAPAMISGALQHMAPGDFEAVHLVVQRPVRIQQVSLTFHGGTGGSVRVHITGDYGRSVPDTTVDLVAPVLVNYTGTQPVVINLPIPLDLHPARHAWVVVEHVAEPMGLAVAASAGGSYHSMVYSAWQIQQLMAMGGDAATFKWVQVSGASNQALEYAVVVSGQWICDLQGPTWFSDGTQAAGLVGTSNQTSVVDVDNDGWDDIVGTRTVTTGMTSTDSLVVWRNAHNGTFTDITTATGLNNAHGRMALWGDFDSDGDLDVYAGAYVSGVGPFSPPTESTVWLQGAGGVFAVLPETMEPDGPTAAGSVGDCDADGIPDLFVGQWLRTYPSDPAPDFLFRGTGMGNFLNISHQAGLPSLTFQYLPTYGVTFVDWNNDGIQDIFVADYGGNPNRAYQNDGHCNLTDVAATIGSDSDGMGSAGTSFGYAFGDYDNDGNLDTYETNIAHPRYDESGIFTDHSRLLHSQGAPGYAFDNVVSTAGILFTEGEISSDWGDFDNDGDLDLYVAITYPFEFSRLYRQDAGHFFWDETYAAGAATEINGRAVWYDYDHDGRLDLLTIPGGTWKLFHNDVQNSNHWIEVRVDQPVATHPVNTHALGARINVRDASNITRIRELSGGTATWGSQTPLTQHVGLGTAGGPVDITVRWPDGMTTDYPGVSPDHRWHITRGSSPVMDP